MARDKSNLLHSKFMSCTVRIRPFIYAVPSVGRTCVVTLCCLFVMIVSLFAERRIWECALIAGSVLGSVCATLLPAVTMQKLLLPSKRRKRSRMLSAIVEGIITAMILPSSVHPSTAFLLTFVFTLAALNTAPRTNTFVSRPSINVPALAACTAWILGARDAETAVFAASVWDAPLTDMLNSSIFNIFGVNVPVGYMSLFWDAANGGTACCHFNAVTLLSSLVLFSCGMADGMASAVFLFVYMALVRLAGPLVFGGGDMVLAALTGGTLFCAVFVVNRPGTLPMSRAGRTAYAISCGVLAFFIAGPLPSARSIPFAILCGNVISILIRYMEDLLTRAVSERASIAAVAHNDIINGGGQ